MIKFTIPGELPDMNQILDMAKSVYGVKAYSALKRQYTNMVAWTAKAAKIPQMNRINIICNWFCPDAKKDKDNIAVGIKFILDGLVTAGVIKNDGWKQINDITHRYYIDREKPRIEVEIEQLI